MKNVLKNFDDLLGKVPHIKYRTKEYGLLAHTLEEFVLRQEKLIDRISWRSDLPPHLVRNLIHESTTIMTFATLLGFDIASFKGAAIGATIGAVIVIGNIAFRIVFIRSQRGVELEIARAG